MEELATQKADTLIAVAALDSSGLEATVSAHFGHAPFFVFVRVSSDGTLSGATQANPFASAHAPGQLPAWLGEQRIDVVIAGGMGGGAIAWFEKLGIRAVTGAAKTVRLAVEEYLAGRSGVAQGCTGHGDHDCDGRGHG